MHVKEMIQTMELHTAGEPVRVITSGYPPVVGDTILAKRDYLSLYLDQYRLRLMREPWGHQDMYGCLLVPAERRDSVCGLIFMHNQGYSTACGHATIAVAKMFVETERIGKAGEGPDLSMKFDVPSGQLTAHVIRGAHQVEDVWFENVPAFAATVNQEIVVRGTRIIVDVGFGGAYYAIVESEQVGLHVDLESIDEFLYWAREIQQAMHITSWTTHPLDARLGGLYGVIFTDSAHQPTCHSRNITVFADGQVDRSPCGSGLSARLATLCEKRILAPGARITVESVIDTLFEGEVLGPGDDVGPYHTVRTAIHGNAYVTGYRTFYVNPDDPIEPFLVR